jgi:hypothetical protein
MHSLGEIDVEKNKGNASVTDLLPSTRHGRTQKRLNDTHTHTHTHTEREREEGEVPQAAILPAEGGPFNDVLLTPCYLITTGPGGISSPGLEKRRFAETKIRHR